MKVIRKLLIFLLNSTADEKVRIYVKLIFLCKKKNIRRLGMFLSNRLQREYGVFLPYSTEFDDTLILRHPVGIVIGTNVKIGKNVTIFQNVTVGRADAKYGEYPVIGDGSIIYTGSVIIGDITIGKNCIIGANSVVLKSIPDNSVVAGAPAKVLRVVDKNE